MLGPDFICIGMAKAGTGWLYDQTSHHPDFWMPPLKEIGYLKEGSKLSRRARILLRKAERKLRKGEAARKRRISLDETDVDFLRAAAGSAGNSKDIESYAALFRCKGELLSGDITPGYSAIGEDTIAELARGLPHVRIVLLVREPIERLWSQVNLRWRTGRFDASLLQDPRQFRKFLRRKGMAEQRALPTEILSAWRAAAPQLALKIVLFDDIAAAPENARGEILSFVGADPGKPSGVLPPGYNRKASTEKLQMPHDIWRLLRKRFRHEIRASAEVFGGAASEWPLRYRL